MHISANFDFADLMIKQYSPAAVVDVTAVTMSYFQACPGLWLF